MNKDKAIRLDMTRLHGFRIARIAGPGAAAGAAVLPIADAKVGAKVGTKSGAKVGLKG